MSRQEWGSLPYLDALRPEPGWRTDFALLATYSADLVAVVAALLSLAGLDDDRGSGSKVDFANAIEALRHRVCVLVQAGRLSAAADTPRILAILDGFVREVGMNEAEGSWHPKIALVRMAAEEGQAAQWRLWVGSRNLTRDSSWDVGLALVGREAAEGRQVPGVPELGRELADRAGLTAAAKARVFAELKRVHWEMPPGCTVEEVRLLPSADRSLPEAPEDVRKLTVVGPFLDGTIVSALGRWGAEGTQRVLLSSRAELGKLAAQASRPLASYGDVLFLDAPLLELEERKTPGEEPKSEDEEPEQRGLHAKLIYAEHAAGRSLWLGSANATQRGWRGPNVEVVARLSVNEEIGAGLDTFIREIGRVTSIEGLVAPEPDDTEERLEKARRQVAAGWAVVQRDLEGRVVLEADVEPHPLDPEIELEVGLLAQPLVAWARGCRSLQLPAVSAGERTELVRCQLSLGPENVSWLQRAPSDPPPGEERDRHALARFLDPRTFLLWIRSLLTGDALGDGGGDWDAAAQRSPGVRGVGPAWWAPTIEEVLKAWAREPVALADVDRKVRRYLELMAEDRGAEQTAEEREALAEFRNSWDVLRRELVESRR